MDQPQRGRVKVEPSHKRVRAFLGGEAVFDTTRPLLVWTYRAPFQDAWKVAGLVAFYDEKVDVTIDGVPQERPR